MTEVTLSKPLVSVIIPTYNRAHFLPDAIESVLAQTYKNWELIVVDDGSTDNTREVVARFGGQVCYLYQENKGCGAARNTGIEYARGEYIALLDSDDVWYPDKLALQVDLFKRFPGTGMVGCGCHWLNSQGARTGVSLPPELLDYRELKVRYAISGTPSTVLINRKALESVGTFDPSLLRCQDWDLWLRIGKEFEIRSVRKVLAASKGRQDLRAEIEKKKAYWLRVIDRHLAGKDRTRAYSWYCFNCAKDSLRQGQKPKALLYLLRSFFLHPGRVCGKKRLPVLLNVILPRQIYVLLERIWIIGKSYVSKGGLANEC